MNVGNCISYLIIFWDDLDSLSDVPSNSPEPRALQTLAGKHISKRLKNRKNREKLKVLFCHLEMCPTV